MLQKKLVARKCAIDGQVKEHYAASAFVAPALLVVGVVQPFVVGGGVKHVAAYSQNSLSLL